MLNEAYGGASTVLVKVVGRDPKGVKLTSPSCFSVCDGSGELTISSSGTLLFNAGRSFIVSSSACVHPFLLPFPRLPGASGHLIDGTS